jgi:hypothetical protein
MAEFQRQLRRVGVDLRATRDDLHEVFPEQRRDLPDGGYEVAFTIDVSGIMETLHSLPDGAGTAAFVAAYNAAHKDWRDRT